MRIFLLIASMFVCSLAFSQTRAFRGANTKVGYMDAQWKVIPQFRYIEGTVKYRFQNRGDAFVYFDLAANMDVDSVLYHGSRISPVRSGDTLFCPVSRLNATDSITVYYQGAPRTTGFDAFMQSSGSFTRTGIYTMSPPFGSRDWWPSRIRLTEKIDSVDIRIVCPLGNYALSNGKMIAKDTLNRNFHRFHWRHKYPIASYLVSMGVSNYVLIRDTARLVSGDIPLELYAYSNTAAAARAQIPNLKRILSLYDSLFMPYPFKDEKYALAEFTFGGGMENQTASFIGNWERQLIAHETSHQWFGDMVTCGTWGDMWLNEGFATYMEGLSFQYFDGNLAYRNWRKDRVKGLCAPFFTEMGSVQVPDSSDYQRIYSSDFTYNKGAMVVQMLRHRLGDSAFFLGVRNYLSNHKFGYVRNNDLKSSLEAASGDTLSHFFQRWLYWNDYPQYGSSASSSLPYPIIQSNSHVYLDIPNLVDTNYVGSTIVSRRASLVNNALFIPYSDAPWINGDYAILAVPHKWGVLATEPELSTSLSVFPNPTKDVVIVQGLQLPSNYILTSTIGQVVQKGVLQPEDSLSISSLPNGFYFLICNGSSTKICKQ